MGESVNPFRRHGVAYAVLSLLFVGWATAIPVGQVSTVSYSWYLDDWPLDGHAIRVVGQTRYVAQGYGLPNGLVRHGTIEWSAAEEGRNASFRAGVAPSTTATTIVVTDAMKQAVLAGFPDLTDVSGPEGWSVSTRGMVPPSPVLAFVLFAISCAWWTRLAEWRWDPARGLARNALACALLAFWPWLLLQGTGRSMRRQLALPEELLVSPDTAIMGTALVLALGLVLFMGKRAPETLAQPA